MGDGRGPADDAARRIETELADRHDQDAEGLSRSGPRLRELLEPSGTWPAGELVHQWVLLRMS